jgi:hypothetical protein
LRHSQAHGSSHQVTSHLYSFGIRGKQFQYIEGKLPEGFPFHGRLTDHDVRNLQGRGAEVIVVNQNYTSEELKQARADCRGETGTTPLQSEAKEAPAQSATEKDHGGGATTTCFSFEVAFCDLKFSSSFLFKRNMKSAGKRRRLRFTCSFSLFTATPYSCARSSSRITRLPRIMRIFDSAGLASTAMLAFMIVSPASPFALPTGFIRL